MASKHCVLTEDEIRNFKLRGSVVEMLNSCCSRFGITIKELRVLDWGCGRGLLVAKLLEMGVDAYGVDVDQSPIRNGSGVLRHRGEDPEKRLVCIASDCRTSFADGYFHLVLSDQVFEHVRHLEALVSELARITVQGGFGLHFYPAKWKIIEPHLKVPFVHWLPKNRLRFWYLFLLINRIPVWEGLAERGWVEKADVYYAYSLEKTYYRKFGTVANLLESAGLKVSIIKRARLTWIMKVCFPFLLLHNRFSIKFRNWFSVTFFHVSIQTIKK